MSRVGVVAIGRNEGERLRRCLLSLAGERVVYVDSGSTDGSAALARALGAEVVELDASKPFTAARGRNAGFAALMASDPPDHVQFVDGDCAVEPGWIAAAAAALDADPALGLVTGWRTELDPGRNAYHRMAEIDWRRPAGPIASCGGDMMVRADAFRAAGGFGDAIICSEDEEFCLRLRARTGLGAMRLPRVMTRHDADTARFSEWWRRQVRAGHGYAEVGRLFPRHFRAERRRAWAYGGALPALALGGAAAGTWWLPALAALVCAASGARIARGLRRSAGLARPEALALAAFGVLVKVPNLQGMALHHLRRLRGAEARLIEYKRPRFAPGPRPIRPRCAGPEDP